MAKRSKKTGKQSATSSQEMQNAAKTLYANIRFMSPDDPISTLAITSSVPNEGKTTVSIQLAQAMATAGKSTLLVEADMRRRSIANRLDIRPPHGAYAVLTNNASAGDAIVKTGVENMYFLDMEPHIPNPADILASNRYKKLVRMLEERFDYVIFDTPPTITFVDSSILSTLVDGTILVVRPNTTKRAELLRAYDQLKKANANVIGACANCVESDGAEYYYAYYSQSGKRVSDAVKAAAEVSNEQQTFDFAPTSTGSDGGGWRSINVPSFDKKNR